VRDSENSTDDEGNDAGAPGGDPTAPHSSAGFFARLDTVNLAELIQLHCQREVQAAFRVTSAQATGYLFFERGQVAHATFGANVGVDAVAHMLELQAGLFESSTQPWPARGNLGMDASTLLLAADRRGDEGGASGTIPPSSSEEKTVEMPAVDERMIAARRSGKAPRTLPPPRKSRRPESFQRPSSHVAARAARGNLRTARFVLPDGASKSAGASEGALIEAAGFVYRLCGLVGEALALGESFVIEIGAASRVLVIFAPETDHLFAALGERDVLAPVLGGRGRDPDVGWAERHATRDERGLDSLSSLCDVEGVLGGMIGHARGQLLASSLPSRISQPAVAEATSRLSGLFHFCSQMGVEADGCELRFAAHRLAVASGPGGLVAVVGAASIQPRWLSSAARTIGRRLPVLGTQPATLTFEFDGELTSVFTRLSPERH